MSKYQAFRYQVILFVVCLFMISSILISLPAHAQELSQYDKYSFEVSLDTGDILLDKVWDYAMTGYYPVIAEEDITLERAHRKVLREWVESNKDMLKSMPLGEDEKAMLIFKEHIRNVFHEIIGSGEEIFDSYNRWIRDNSSIRDDVVWGYFKAAVENYVTYGDYYTISYEKLERMISDGNKIDNLPDDVLLHMDFPNTSTFSLRNYYNPEYANILFRVGEHKILDGVPRRYQETDYWCGPATVQMVLGYFGKNVEQSDLAGEVMIGKASYVYKMENAINKRIYYPKYEYITLGDYVTQFWGRGIEVEERNAPTDVRVKNSKKVLMLVNVLKEALSKGPVIAAVNTAVAPTKAIIPANSESYWNPSDLTRTSFFSLPGYFKLDANSSRIEKRHSTNHFVVVVGVGREYDGVHYVEYYDSNTFHYYYPVVPSPYEIMTRASGKVIKVPARVFAAAVYGTLNKTYYDWRSGYLILPKDN